MKRTITLLFTVLITACGSITSAQQVRKIFKILEFPSNKPLEGASCTYYGQTITSNAKGVAVLNLPSDRKGDFIPRDRWFLDQYIYIGRISTDDRNQFFQNRDTLRLYMLKESDYDAEVQNLFKNYFDFAYRTSAQALLAYNDSLRLHPYYYERYAQALIDQVSPGHAQLSKDAYSDAISTLPCYLYCYSPDIQEGVTDILQSGDVNRAVAAAKAKINPEDTSPANLHRILFYMTLKDLDLATQDTQSVLNYSKMLYEQHFAINSATEYIFALADEDRYDEAEAIAQKEKANPHLPFDEYAFYPLPSKYLWEEDDDSLRIAINRQTQIFQDVYRRYPSIDILDYLAWSQTVQCFVYQYLSDTLNANKSLDSALASYNQCLDANHSSPMKRNQQKISLYTKLLKYTNWGISNRMDSIQLALGAAIYHAAKENYEMDPDNLFLQLQYAAKNAQYIDMLSGMDIYDSAWTSPIRELSVLNDILAAKYPEIFTVENITTKALLLGIDMDQNLSEATIRNSLLKFKDTYSAVNSLYPDIFTSKFLAMVSVVVETARDNDYKLLAADANLFLDELLHHSAQYAGKSFDAQKALYLNDQAEQYYEKENYPKSIQYYERANEQFQKVTAEEPSLWSTFLLNYLQMGDAYLHQEKFDEALNAYRKILSYEKQIPADQTATYTMMKGNAYYFEGDVWGHQGDWVTAEKCYKKAEKLFLKAIQTSESRAAQPLGEMYFMKAIRQYTQGNIQKVYPLIEQSVKYYESTPFEKPLQRYEQANSILLDYYQEKKDSVHYVNRLRGFSNYYHQFAKYDTSFANNSIYYTGKYLNINIPHEEELLYSRNIVTDHERILPMTGLTLKYLQRKFQLAKAWQEVDSLQQAIDEYKECLSLNTIMYRDTAPDFCLANETEIHKALITCFSAMGELYEHEENLSKEWYEKALEASDTLIQIMEHLRTGDDAEQTYDLAIQYYRNAFLCAQTEWFSVALTQLDKSNELLLELYNGHYKAETEFDIIRNHYLKGMIAEDMGNTTLAKECFFAASEYAERASDPNNTAALYYEVVSNWLRILEVTEDGQDAVTIAKLKQLKTTLSKKLRK